MAPKKSSYYQSRFRARLREQGYVKREVWVPPDCAGALKACEQALRDGIVPIVPEQPTERQMSQIENWTTESLCQALQDFGPADERRFEVELIEGADPGILISMSEFGDLPLLMSVSGSQIVVDTLLWPVAEVEDPAAFNEMILRTHKLFPLSTFAITSGPDGQDYYELFGSLSASSSLDAVILEIETLADNAIQAADAYQSELARAA